MDYELQVVYLEEWRKKERERYARAAKIINKIKATGIPFKVVRDGLLIDPFEAPITEAA